MKKISLILTVVFVTPLSAMQTQPAQPPAPVVVNNYINLDASAQSTAAAAQDNNQQAVQNVEQNVVQKTYQKMLSYMQSINYNEIKQAGQQGLDALLVHKYKIIGGCLAVVYAGIFYRLLKDYHYLCNGDIWANWKQHLAFDQLCTISQKQLAQDLVRDIQGKYMNTQNPTDHISPLAKFMQAADLEQKIIKRYIRNASWIDKCHLTSLFPTNHTKIAFTKERQERLAFVKHIFLSWTAENNMAQIMPHSVVVNSTSALAAPAA